MAYGDREEVARIVRVGGRLHIEYLPGHRHGDQDHLVQLCVTLLDTAMELHRAVDHETVQAKVEREHSRRARHFSHVVAAHGWQSLWQNELSRWHRDKTGQWQRVVAAADLWKDTRPPATKLRNLAREYFKGLPAPIPREDG